MKSVMARPPASAAEVQRIYQLSIGAHSLAGRARAVLQSWRGKSTAAIARDIGCHPQTIRAYLHAFNAEGIAQQNGHLDGKTGVVVHESGLPLESPRGVPAHLTHTYIHMNGEFPMAPAATDPAIGYAVLMAISRRGAPDPDETEEGWKSEGLDWLSYYYSAFSPGQLDTIGHTMTQLHLDADIPIVTAEHLPVIAAAHPGNRERLLQASATCIRLFLQSDPPVTPPHCVIEQTDFGSLAIVSLDAIRSGWHFIKERVFLAMLNVVDALPEGASRLSRPRVDGPDGSPLTVANALRLAQFAASPHFTIYEQALLACYQAAYTIILESAALAKTQHADYQLANGGSPAFRVTTSLVELIDRIAEAITQTSASLPPLRTGQPVLPPGAVQGLIDDLTRRNDEPAS
jgi:hypothetical protein